MLKLYGFSVSNYYNMVKLALLEKGLPFEEVAFYPGQSPEALMISPRGKVPVLGVEQGYINETTVILEYLEDTQGGQPLLPREPFQRAQVMALAKEIELYIELPARACFTEAFFGMPVPEAIKEKTRGELLLGFAALKRHGKFAPYVAGSEFTVADLYFLYSVDLACAVGGKLFGIDLLADMPQAKALLERLQQTEHARRIAADKEAAMPAFLAMIAAKK
ncbi:MULTISPECIES: glutathione S-transferase [Pseudomonas]|uniref:Glutathione S-transferase n=1 Tax=Pseudomonas asplenii TaxID=53407 RepID=A0A0N0E348_9PSED|nr:MULTISPECIES: glutathione S-transferase [Pseudomonas]KPA89631.1 glutathione S-transferase [Pseudomonas fuscovaginae]KPA96315.1 glutathione S-transferase [Pseudomonas fuscovaginae]